MQFGKSRRARRLLVQADRAREKALWRDAADLYRKVVELRPEWTSIQIQLGHALKESGDLKRAELAYRVAAEWPTARADASLHLGHIAKLEGRLADAIDAYASALVADPSLHAARSELLHLGARDALPEMGPAGLRRAKAFAELQRSFNGMAREWEHWMRDAPAPPTQYADFYNGYHVTAPPQKPNAPLFVVIDARLASAWQIRATLLSLIDQSFDTWTAEVMGGSFENHTVASFGNIDARIRFSPDPPTPKGLPIDAVAYIEAGAILHREGLAWLAFGARSGGTSAVYADHDSVLLDWRHGRRHFAPSLYPMFDRFFFAATDEIPIAILVRQTVFAECIVGNHRYMAKKLLLRASDLGSVVHIPVILSSRGTMPSTIYGGSDDLPSGISERGVSSRRSDNRSIAVIIPTRDQSEMLESCVEALLAKAAKPHRVEILIVDNRSVERETKSLLLRWAAEQKARTIAFLEPFNWSRANNYGVRNSESDIICFVNNDTKMVSEAWDDIVDSALEPDVGVCGARLMYADRTLQHAGVLFGIGQGSPVHEGVGAAADDGGPMNRWLTRRAVPAVTGAFLCCRRDDFCRVRGFDESLLPIGFNDIDFCMRVRSLGRSVLYEPELLLFHYESQTRGLNDTISKLAWDQAELESFHARWGDEMFLDPGYNPHWSRKGNAFDGFQRPTERLVLEYIAKSEKGLAWTTIAPRVGV